MLVGRQWFSSLRHFGFSALFQSFFGANFVFWKNEDERSAETRTPLPPSRRVSAAVPENNDNSCSRETWSDHPRENSESSALPYHIDLLSFSFLLLPFVFEGNPRSY
eukprot:scaffold7825_cov162-Amphora_coffeaeformis.AAC.12